MLETSIGELVARIAMAAACGGLIGLDREAKSRPAGLRTMSLVALGACLFAFLGNSLAEALDGAVRADAVSRVLQGLVGGIGFLGAATVFKSQLGSQGVTTAATVWVVAAIGAACGLGQYVPAGAVTAAAVFILLALKPVERWMAGKRGEGTAASGETGDGSNGSTPEARSPRAL